MRAYLAVTLALTAGLVAEVGLFASRYVGRLAERDLLAIAPAHLPGTVPLAREVRREPGARRSSSRSWSPGSCSSCPLGRLVHKAALPDAFTLVRQRLGQLELLVWGFTAAAVLAFVLLPRRHLVAVPVVLALVFAGSSLAVSIYVANEATKHEVSFFGGQARGGSTARDGEVAYFYDGEPN